MKDMASSDELLIPSEIMWIVPLLLKLFQSLFYRKVQGVLKYAGMTVVAFYYAIPAN